MRSKINTKNETDLNIYAVIKRININLAFNDAKGEWVEISKRGGEGGERDFSSGYLGQLKLSTTRDTFQVAAKPSASV